MPNRSYVYWYLVSKDFLPLLTRRNNVVAVLVFTRLDGAIPSGFTTRVPCITERDQLGCPRGEHVSVRTAEQIPEEISEEKIVVEIAFLSPEGLLQELRHKQFNLNGFQCYIAVLLHCLGHFDHLPKIKIGRATYRERLCHYM